MLLPYIHEKESHHQTVGSNTKRPREIANRTGVFALRKAGAINPTFNTFSPAESFQVSRSIGG